MTEFVNPFTDKSKDANTTEVRPWQQPQGMNPAPAVSEYDSNNPGATTNFGGVVDTSSPPLNKDDEIVGDPANGGAPINEDLAKIKAEERGGPEIVKDKLPPFGIPSSEPASGGPASGGIIGDQNADDLKKSHMLAGTKLPIPADVVVDDHTEVVEGEATVYKVKSNYAEQHLNELHDKVISIMDNRLESEIPHADPYWAANNAYRQALKARNLI